MAQVFISHSARDKAIADTACATLEAAGIACWIAPRDVVPGSSYPAEIIRGLETAVIVLFIYTKASNESRAVQKELERGVSRGKAILPFRLEEVVPTDAVDYLIANEHWLDATVAPMEARLQELVGAVKDLLQRAATHPTQTARSTPSRTAATVPLPSVAAPRGGRGRIFILLGLILWAAAGYFLYRHYHSAPGAAAPTAAEVELAARTPVLLSPANGAEIVGSDARPNLILEFKLPEKRDRSARIEVQPEGQPAQPPVVWAGSSYLVSGVEGVLKWRVQASWRGETGQVETGPWSEWRSVTFYPHRLSHILRTGKCLIGTADLSPTDKLVNFDPATLRPGGYEVELLHAFFASQKPAQEVVISYQQQPEGWGEKYFHMLSTAPEVDFLVSGITPTPAREKAWGIEFSLPTFKFHQVLLTRKGEAAVKEGQIVAQTVGAAANTTNADFLLRLLGGAGPRVEIDPGPKSYPSLMNGLQSRRIDAFLVDEVYLTTLFKTFPGMAERLEVTKLRPSENPRFELSGSAYAFRPEDRVLREAIGAFLKEKPEYRRELQQKFFPELEFIP